MFLSCFGPSLALLQSCLLCLFASLTVATFTSSVWTPWRCSLPVVPGLCFCATLWTVSSSVVCGSFCRRLGGGTQLHRCDAWFAFCLEGPLGLMERHRGNAWQEEYGTREIWKVWIWHVEFGGGRSAFFLFFCLSKMVDKGATNAQKFYLIQTTKVWETRAVCQCSRGPQLRLSHKNHTDIH